MLSRQRRFFEQHALRISTDFKNAIQASNEGVSIYSFPTGDTLPLSDSSRHSVIGNGFAWMTPQASVLP
jgi:hypothetical protein